MKKTRLFVPITKTEKQADGTIVVYGKATGPDLDADQQIMDPAWLAKAVPAWFETGANVREMHQPIAAGVGQTLEQQGDDWYLKTLVVDPGSVKKVEAKVLKGYSIGIAGGKVVKDLRAPGGRVVDGDIVEISLADRGSNATCKMAICKAAGDTVDGDVMVDADEEAQEAVTVEEVERLVAALLYAEAAELLEGGEATGAIRALLYVLDDLEWFQQIDSYEDAVGKAAAATTKGSAMHLTELLASVKTAGADDATEAQKSVLTEVREALFPTVELETVVGELQVGKSLLAELTKIDSVEDLDDEQKDAVAALRKVLGVDEIAGNATKTAALEERLVKVEELAAPGGPDRTRPVDPAAQAAKTSLLTKAAEYRELAGKVTNPAVADGYRSLAARAEQLATAPPTS